MAHNVVCKNVDMAVQIIGTVAKSMKPGTQRDALTAAAEWVQRNMLDMPDTPEKRKALVLELETVMRNCMTDERRREKTAFYLEGLKK